MICLSVLLRMVVDTRWGPLQLGIEVLIMIARLPIRVRMKMTRRSRGAMSKLHCVTVDGARIWTELEDQKTVCFQHVTTPEFVPELPIAMASKTICESVYNVCELFSPSRVSDVATKMGLRGGWSLYLTSACVITPRKWDFRRPGDRRLARSGAAGQATGGCPQSSVHSI